MARKKHNKGHNTNNSLISSNKSRKELQEICKKNGIKANISSDDMIKCINLIILNKKIPDKFRKQTWFELHKDSILTDVTIASAAITTATLCMFFKYNR